MVKGTTRQIIMVKPPDTKLFEQAIFILREDALETDGMSEDEILQQAQHAAGSYVATQLPTKHRRLKICKNLLWFLLGLGLGLLTALIW